MMTVNVYSNSIKDFCGTDNEFFLFAQILYCFNLFKFNYYAFKILNILDSDRVNINNKLIDFMIICVIKFFLAQYYQLHYPF